MSVYAIAATAWAVLSIVVSLILGGILRVSKGADREAARLARLDAKLRREGVVRELPVGQPPRARV